MEHLNEMVHLLLKRGTNIHVKSGLSKDALKFARIKATGKRKSKLILSYSEGRPLAEDI